jgi:anti-sigma-K factor RskA
MIARKTNAGPLHDGALESRYKLSRSFIAVVIAVILVIGVAAWVAGFQSGQLRSAQLVSELTDVQQEASKLRVQLGQRDSKVQQLDHSLKTAGTETQATETEAMRQQILRLQAQLNNLQSVAARDTQARAENESLLNILGTPGVRLTPLKGVDAAAGSVAYALILENHEVIVVASNVPKPDSGRDYQLWLIRKDEPQIVSGGLLNGDDTDRAIVRFSSADLVSGITALNVTEEPAGGSDTPTGPKIYTTVTEE